MEDPFLHSNGFFPYEDPRQKIQRDRESQIEHSRNRLIFVLAAAHGMVELSLRHQSPQVRNVVKQDLVRRYGLKSPALGV